MRATTDTNIAEAKRRLTAAVESLRRARSELIGIARLLRADPRCQDTHRRQRAGDVSANSVPYSMEQRCLSVAEDLPRDVIVPLERELRLTQSQCERMEAQHRRMMEKVHRRIWRTEAAENLRHLEEAA